MKIQKSKQNSKVNMIITDHQINPTLLEILQISIGILMISMGAWKLKKTANIRLKTVEFPIILINIIIKSLKWPTQKFRMGLIAGFNQIKQEFPKIDLEAVWIILRKAILSWTVERN